MGLLSTTEYARKRGIRVPQSLCAPSLTASPHHRFTASRKRFPTTISPSPERHNHLSHTHLRSIAASAFTRIHKVLGRKQKVISRKLKEIEGKLKEGEGDNRMTMKTGNETGTQIVYETSCVPVSFPPSFISLIGATAARPTLDALRAHFAADAETGSRVNAIRIARNSAPQRALA